MKFVSHRIEAEWNNPQLNARLKIIVAEASAYALERWKWEFTITSIYRSPEEDAALKASGVHSHWRAVDVRTRGRSQKAIDDVAAYANTRWIYDPKRPSLKVCFTEPHGTGPHAHFQAHDNTKRTDELAEVKPK